MSCDAGGYGERCGRHPPVFYQAWWAGAAPFPCDSVACVVSSSFGCYFVCPFHCCCSAAASWLSLVVVLVAVVLLSVALVEFALLSPLFGVLLAGTIDLSGVLYTKFRLDDSVAAGANYALINAASVNSSSGASI